MGTGVRGLLVEFDIVVLGPVELRVDGRREMYGAAKEIQLLAALALDAGKAISLDLLTRRLWEDDPPAKPRASLHAYATRIRRKLGNDVLLQQAHAYTLDIAPLTVDYHRFERLTVQARSLASSGDDAQALALLRSAESLWRGVPLTGFPGMWAEQVRRGLAERRLAATLLRSGIELRMGHFAVLMDELSALADQYPTDETVVGRFMAAAYGNGRQTDALRRYESLRRRLREEGTEPGEALSRVYRRILDRAPVGELIDDDRPPGTPLPAPQNLPAHSDLLIGRTEQLRALQADGARVIAFQAISGMAGVGKSLLALHAARTQARHYPDGQIYLNLRAHSGQRPLTPEAALSRLLRDFGIPTQAVPHDLDGLVTLWRTVLGSRRAIVVLDDVADAAQVQPLLPGDSPSLVLITSRRRLTGVSGIHHVFLDVLSPEDAEALLVELAGPAPDHDPAQTAALARLCGYLPLALALAAGRLRSRPAWTMGHLVRRMSQDPGRLAEIRDGQWEIETVFAFSYDTLPPDQQRVFRLLSLHPAPVFGPHATAALVGLPLAVTERILEALLDAHLLQEPVADRYEFHDLIGAYAHSLAVRDPESTRQQALDRVAVFCLHAVAAADRLLYPRRPRPDLPLPPPPFALPHWADARQAKAWLLAEATALTASESHLRGRGRHREASHLAHAAAGFLDSEGLWGEAEEMHSHAVRHWQSTGDRSLEAHALVNLAAAHSQTGRYEEADTTSRRALAAARAAGDAAAEAESLRALGLLSWNLGRLRESLAFQQEALDIAVRSGDLWHISRFQNNLGIALLHLGEYARAMRCFSAALDGFVRTQDARGEAQALNNAGDAHRRMGEDEPAHNAFKRALELVTQFGSRAEQAIAQMNLAITLHGPENLESALDLHRQALATFRHINDKRNETVALNAIGTALYQAAQYAEASAHHAAALTLSRTIGAAQEEIQALHGLGVAELRAGHHEAASERLTEALAIAERIGASEEAAHAHESLADLHAAVGQEEEAVRYLLLAYARSTFNETAATRIRRRLRELGRELNLRE